ncbi:MAG: DUF4276 family protein [Sulfurisoma sp.]|nr:DUF4276 family protein [Sulfurisoma sp.]
MKLYPIVEGHGEVAAAPVLLRRLLWDQAQCYGMDVGTPIRRTCSQFRREEEVQRIVRVALLQPDCAAVLLLFDGEDDCPFELAAKVRGWAQAAAGQTPCEVVIAYREYETWFLASVESLRGRWGIAGDALAPINPEAKRNAKGALEEFMPANCAYSPTVHQADMSANFDMALAHRRNRSFRKLVKTVGDLLGQLGQTIPAWPPVEWQP